MNHITRKTISGPGASALLVGLMFWACPAVSKGASPSLILSETRLGQASSASPVGFAFLTERGHQFVAYYDAERRITVAGRQLDGTNWTFFHPAGVLVTNRHRDSNVTAWDAHN